MALPVLNGLILRAGHPVQVFSPIGDPRDIEDLPSSVIGLPAPFELAPMFLSDFLHIENLTADEASHLGETLGVQLTKAARIDLHLIIQRFVSSIALAGRLPSWKQYAERLKEILAVSNQLVASAQRFVALTMWKRDDAPSEPGVLSLDASVKEGFRLA